ncbi:hypothetical protein [Novosphingobium rosa]|uniref:hypothetical protein n=1 Tax=Novosphingobium rosa TaxID=76978 RepID=UPI00082F595A|nr:hypothetical protein [Novosphingobium rosa]
MNAIPPEFHAALAETTPLGQRWAALAGAAQVIAQLAGQSDLAIVPPAGLLTITGKRRALVDQALDDLLAVLEPGLTALLHVEHHGGSSAPAARALWQEFLRARQGLAALIPPA